MWAVGAAAASSMLLARFWMCRPTPSPLALHQPPRSSALVLVRVLVNEMEKRFFAASLELQGQVRCPLAALGSCFPPLLPLLPLDLLLCVLNV